MLRGEFRVKNGSRCWTLKKKIIYIMYTYLHSCWFLSSLQLYLYLYVYVFLPSLLFLLLSTFRKCILLNFIYLRPRCIDKAHVHTYHRKGTECLPLSQLFEKGKKRMSEMFSTRRMPSTRGGL